MPAHVRERDDNDLPIILGHKQEGGVERHQISYGN
mgnify:CR=1 FL=1